MAFFGTWDLDARLVSLSLSNGKTFLLRFIHDELEKQGD